MEEEAEYRRLKFCFLQVVCVLLILAVNIVAFDCNPSIQILTVLFSWCLLVGAMRGRLWYVRRKRIREVETAVAIDMIMNLWFQRYTPHLRFNIQVDDEMGRWLKQEMGGAA